MLPAAPSASGVVRVESEVMSGGVARAVLPQCTNDPAARDQSRQNRNPADRPLRRAAVLSDYDLVSGRVRPPDEPFAPGPSRTAPHCAARTCSKIKSKRWQSHGAEVGEKAASHVRADGGRDALPS